MKVIYTEDTSHPLTSIPQYTDQEVLVQGQGHLRKKLHTVLLSQGKTKVTG